MGPRLRWIQRLLIAASIGINGLSAAAQGPAAGSPPDPFPMWHDARGLVNWADLAPSGVELRTHVTRSEYGGWESGERRPYPDNPPSIDAWDCAAWVERVLLQTPGCDPQGIDLRRGRIWVLGDPTTQARAAAATREVVEAVNRTTVVEVRRIPHAQVPEGTPVVLDAQGAASLIRSLPAAAPLVGTVPMGQPWTLGAESLTAFMADCSPETAYKVMLPDPTVSVAPMGMMVGLRLDQASNASGLVVRAWTSRGELKRPFRSIAIPGFGGSTIELPEASTTMGAVSAIVPQRGALLAQFHPDEFLLFQFREAPTTRDRSLGPIPLGEHVTPPMRMSPMDLPFADSSGGRFPLDWAEGSWWSPLEATLSDEPHDFAAWVLGLPEPLQRYMPVGSGLIPADDQSRAELIRELDAYREHVELFTAEYEFAYGVISSTEPHPTRTQEERAALARSLPYRARGCCLEGDSIASVGGLERAYLYDYTTQIGNSMSPDYPMVASVFEGISLWFSPVAKIDGRLRASYEVIFQPPHGPFRPAKAPALLPWDGPGRNQLDHIAHPHHTYAQLPLELATTKRVNFRNTATLSNGQWHVATIQDLGDGETQFALLIRTRLR